VKGEIVAIYVAQKAGASMQLVPSAELEPGQGIVGDRYHQRAGTFSSELAVKGLHDWQVTLIEIEEIDEFGESAKPELGRGDLRRNIVTRNVRLNALVGQQFRVGDAILEGTRLCEPCAYLAKLVSSRVLPALIGRAGLRACIVQGGLISPGERVGATVI